LALWEGKRKRETYSAARGIQKWAVYMERVFSSLDIRGGKEGESFRRLVNQRELKPGDRCRGLLVRGV